MCSSVDGYYRLGATVLVACASPPLIESILGGLENDGTPGLFTCTSTTGTGLN